MGSLYEKDETELHRAQLDNVLPGDLRTSQASPRLFSSPQGPPLTEDGTPHAQSLVMRQRQLAFL